MARVVVNTCLAKGETGVAFYNSKGGFELVRSIRRKAALQLQSACLFLERSIEASKEAIKRIRKLRKFIIAAHGQAFGAIITPNASRRLGHPLDPAQDPVGEYRTHPSRAKQAYRY